MTVQTPGRLATSIVLHAIESISVSSVLAGHIPKQDVLVNDDFEYLSLNSRDIAVIISSSLFAHHP